MRTVRTICFILPLLAVGIASPATAADSVVVFRSNSQDFPLGTTFDGTAVLNLAEGVQLTLLSEDGFSVTISGPYSAAPLPTEPVSSGSGLIDTLSPLFTDPSKDETVIGAFRNPDDDREALAWTIDAILLKRSTGVICRDLSQVLTIARPKGEQAAIVMLERLDSPHRAELTFPADGTAVPWPAAVSTNEGARFRLTMAGSPVSSEFAIAMVPAKLPTSAHRAAWMAVHGCRVQARRLINLTY